MLMMMNAREFRRGACVNLPQQRVAVARGRLKRYKFDNTESILDLHKTVQSINSSVDIMGLCDAVSGHDGDHQE